MSAVSDYAYLNCRVSIRAEGLLPRSRLAELVSRPMNQVSDTLRDAGFVQLADEIPTSSRALEQTIIADYLDDIAVLMRPLKGAARAFIAHWQHRYEIINLKRCIRHHLHGLPSADLRDSLVDLGELALLPIDDLLRAESADEVLRRLEGTVYADMARHARRVYDERHSIFDLEAVLDRQYYNGLFKRFRALADNDREHLASLVGELADQINLVWLLRYRFAFGLESPHAYVLLVHPGKLLTRSRLLHLVQLESLEEVLQALPEPLAGRLADAASILEVETVMARQTQRTARWILRRTGFNLARAFAYLVLRERQILHVHAALKGRLLELDEEAIVLAASLPDSFVNGATVSG